MVGGVLVDVRNRLVQARHHLDADDGCQVLLKPVLLGGVGQLGTRHGLQNCAAFSADTHFHTLVGVDLANQRQELRRDTARHQQAFGGIAWAVFVRFGVVGHGDGHGDVAGVIHIHMAVAVQVLDDRHLGIAADALDQALAPARNDHVHILRHGDELADHGAVGGLHQLHRIGRQAAFRERLLHQFGQRLVGLNRLRATAQYAGIAALDGQAGGLDRRVGPALENHAKHADRHAHLADADAAGLLLHARDFADHIGHGGELFTSLGTGFQHLWRQLEPVHHGCGKSGGDSALQVTGVVHLQGLGVVTQQGGQTTQRLVLDGGRGRRHYTGGGLGLAAQGLGGIRKSGRVHPRIFAEAGRPGLAQSRGGATAPRIATMAASRCQGRP